MHLLITIDELDTLTEFDLLGLEARLRDLILAHDLSETDRLRCLTSLSNVVFVRTLRTGGPAFAGPKR